MKKRLLFSLMVCSLYASEQTNYIELGFGQLKEKDNFSVESDKSISSLGKADSETLYFPYVGFNFNYNLNETSSIYVNSQLGDFSLGSNIKTPHGSFDFGFTTNFYDEAWENPYLTNEKREKTKVKKNGTYFTYGKSFFASHEFSITHKYKEVDYDKDTLSKKLKRDAKEHTISVDNNFSSNIKNLPITYLTNVAYKIYDADGKASSYKKASFAIGANLQINKRFDLTLLNSFARKDYEEHNSFVDKKVSSDIYGFMSTFKWNEPFNYKNTYLSFQNGYIKEEANANFFDKEKKFALVSIGYKF